MQRVMPFDQRIADDFAHRLQVLWIDDAGR
jgi:hypothetical protein